MEVITVNKVKCRLRYVSSAVASLWLVSNTPALAASPVAQPELKMAPASHQEARATQPGPAAGGMTIGTVHPMTLFAGVLLVVPFAIGTLRIPGKIRLARLSML
jgi:hypothetical protein